MSGIRFDVSDRLPASLAELSLFEAPTLDSVPPPAPLENLKKAVPASEPAVTSAPTVQTLAERGRAYVAKHNPHLVILTPCFGSQCYVNYVVSLMNTMTLFREIGFTLSVEFCKSDSLVSRARNNLMAKAMAIPSVTHTIFIDADIMWNPIDVLKLVLADKPLVGGVYPLKNYKWETLTRRAPDAPADAAPLHVVADWLKTRANIGSEMSDIDMIRAKLLSYNINYVDNVLKVEENLAEVRHLATGFMLVRRDAFDAMRAAFPSTKYTDDVGFLAPHQSAFAYALFDCGVVEDHYYSEDWLFCHRWTSLGGKTFVDISISLTHTGIEDYAGSYLTSLLVVDKN
jgi:hypothetical protein